MNRRAALLAVLASADGRPFTPAQLQKAMFLLVQNYQITEGLGYNFEAYDYGPFDKAVYDEAVMLGREGLAEIGPSPFGRWNVYAASETGVAEGRQTLGILPLEISGYIGRMTEWVRKQSFSSLVRAIYEQYPEMRANSIFQD